MKDAVLQRRVEQRCTWDAPTPPEVAAAGGGVKPLEVSKNKILAGVKINSDTRH